MSTDIARHRSASSPQHPIKRALLGNVCVLGLGIALAMGSSPAAAKFKVKHKSARKETEHVSKDPFGDIPKGPLQIFISINQQKLHLYSDGTHVADALVATGVPGHSTPMGVFSIIEKERYHHSNIYSNAPMPYMQRITWSGVAMHEGPGVGHVASHGCIRMPHEFAARLWALTKLGARVIIARPEMRPTEFADPHLFVHKEKRLAPAAALPEPVKTVQTIDASTTTDAVDLPVRRGPADVPRTSDPTADPAPADAEPASAAVVESTAPSQPAEPALAASPAPTEPGKPDVAGSVPATPAQPAEQPEAQGQALQADTAASVTAAPEDVPMPLPKPAQLTKVALAPIAIFVSRKEGKIYVRQNFAPLLEAPITIEHRERPLGTHVFTAMDYLADGTTFRWNVVSLPGEQPKAARESNYVKKSRKDAKGRRRDEGEAEANPIAAPLPETPQGALARIEIPQDVIDQISQLIVPGSSLVVSDQGLGFETGESTDFIVITR